MSQFEVRAKLKVREGKLEGFRRQAAEMMRVTRDRDTGKAGRLFAAAHALRRHGGLTHGERSRAARGAPPVGTLCRQRRDPPARALPRSRPVRSGGVDLSGWIERFLG